MQVRGKESVLDQLDRHAQLAVRVVVLHGRADRVGAAQVLAVDRRPQRQELALGEAVGVAQRVRHLEGDRNRVGGLGAHLRHAQRMELWSHGSLASARRGSVSGWNRPMRVSAA
jgi:hypothetical protein